ncbi:MAG: hypothetical protein HXX16_16625 [Bacteroidales bacterium]|nr:hypothetical protein [Bacteroidales bacterium]
MINHLDIVLPIAVLLLSFLLKLCIDRAVEIPLFVRSIYELPVDIIFLTISFLVAFTISTTEAGKNNGLFYCFIFLIVSIINVIIWRRAVKLFELNKIFWSIALTAINFACTIYCLNIAISFLTK